MLNLHQASHELASRLVGLFRLDAQQRRPVWVDTPKAQQDQRWRDQLPFCEYFNGDTGAGLGATHQTGWTGLVANLILEQ